MTSQQTTAHRQRGRWLAEGGLLRATATNATVVWAASFGAIWLLTTIMVVFAYLQGKVNSAEVPENLAEVAFWSAMVGPYFNALALPITAPVAILLGLSWAWLRSDKSGRRSDGRLT